MQETPNKTKSTAKRLLERLNSPFLFLASDLENLKKPHTPVSVLSKQIAKEVERFSGGRLALSTDPAPRVESLGLLRFSKLRIYDHRCGNNFRMTVAKMKAVGPDKACPHCNEPRSLDEIGSKAEIQQFVLQRSQNMAFFGNRNRIGDIADVYDFHCIRCKGMPYEAPFNWFLRDSPGTNACPCCAQRLKNQNDLYR